MAAHLFKYMRIKAKVSATVNALKAVKNQPPMTVSTPVTR